MPNFLSQAADKLAGAYQPGGSMADTPLARILSTLGITHAPPPGQPVAPPQYDAQGRNAQGQTPAQASMAGFIQPQPQPGQDAAIQNGMAAQNWRAPQKGNMLNKIMSLFGG